MTQGFLSIAAVAHAGALAATVCGAPALANSYERYFAGKPGGRVCYTRTYDADHLRARDRQLVRQIVLDFDAGKSAGAVNKAERFVIALGVKLRAGKAWLTHAGQCAARADGGFDCALEGNAGRFKLAPDDISLRLTLDGVMSLTGEKPVVIGGKESDEPASLLSPAVNRICDQAMGAAR